MHFIQIIVRQNFLETNLQKYEEKSGHIFQNSISKYWYECGELSEAMNISDSD